MLRSLEVAFYTVYRCFWCVVWIVVFSDASLFQQPSIDPDEAVPPKEDGARKRGPGA